MTGVQTCALPISSVDPGPAEVSAHSGQTPQQALDRLMARGGFPEPCLAEDPVMADRWRRQYATDLIREDVLEFSRLQEVKVMQLLVEMLRERVGSPLSFASLARDLAVSPATIKRYVDILQALFIVFLLPPWHRNVARALSSAPKLYFYDTGMVVDDPAKRFENRSEERRVGKECRSRWSPYH